jgi:hypothetical protein
MQVEHFEHLRNPGLIDLVRAIQLTQSFDLLLAGGIVQHQDRQRFLAAPDVVGLVLAGFLAGAPNPEHVIANLEADAKRSAKLTEPICDLGRGSSNNRPCPGGESHDRRRLALDHRQVIFRRHMCPAFEFEVLDLAADDLDRHPVELIDKFQQRFRLDEVRIRAQEGALGDREEGIPGIDRLGISPDSPNRGAMASVRAAVLDIVVDQREIVQEFDCRRQWRRRSGVATRRNATQECQLRAYPLALDCQPGLGVGRFARGIDPAQVKLGHPGKKRRLSPHLIERDGQLFFQKDIELLLRGGRGVGVNDAFLLGGTMSLLARVQFPPRCRLQVCPVSAGAGVPARPRILHCWVT